MTKYRVENGYTVWNTYDSKDDAESMANYLNSKYHNGYYVRKVISVRTPMCALEKVDEAWKTMNPCVETFLGGCYVIAINKCRFYEGTRISCIR